MPSSKITFKYHEVFNDQVVRKIAFDELGDAYADHIFLCLPGLLETRSTFSTFCQLVHSQFNARTIALDYCGRGDSEALISHSNYKMSTYIKDVNDLLSHYVLKTHQNEQHTLYVVGSSMGGILAMHLCKELKHPIKGIVLNWTVIEMVVNLPFVHSIQTTIPIQKQLFFGPFTACSRSRYFTNQVPRSLRS